MEEDSGNRLLQAMGSLLMAQGRPGVTCPQCKEKLRLKGGLQEHIEKEHSEITIAGKCPLCTYEGSNIPVEDLLAHLKAYHPDRHPKHPHHRESIVENPYAGNVMGRAVSDEVMWEYLSHTQSMYPPLAYELDEDLFLTCDACNHHHMPSEPQRSHGYRSTLLVVQPCKQTYHPGCLDKVGDPSSVSTPTQ